MKRLALLTAFLVLLPAAALGAGFAKVGTFGAQFLKIGTTARATGMGSAFTGVADDATSVFWNPGGLVNVVRNEVELSHVEWPADTKLTSAILAFNPRSIPGTLAISARSLWMDPMLVRTAFNPEGNGQHFDAAAVAPEHLVSLILRLGFCNLIFQFFSSNKQMICFSNMKILKTILKKIN